MLGRARHPKPCELVLPPQFGGFDRRGQLNRLELTIPPPRSFFYQDTNALLVNKSLLIKKGNLDVLQTYHANRAFAVLGRVFAYLCERVTVVFLLFFNLSHKIPLEDMPKRARNTLCGTF